MRTFKQFLQEKLIIVNSSDIERIYKPLKPIVTEVQKILAIKDIPRRIELLKQFSNQKKVWIPLQTIDSSELTSIAAKRAHVLNPIKIMVRRQVYSNNYIPRTKEMNIGLTVGAVDGLGMYSDILSFNKPQLNQLHSEFTEIRVKATIRHELTHWIDDSLNNLHMSKMVGDPDKFQEYLKAGNPDVGYGFIEIQAVVHQIAEVRRIIGKKKYEELTWNELMKLHPSLEYLNERLGAKWRRLIATRMARENLLTKNMRF
jgi:hypothetical protein